MDVFFRDGKNAVLRKGEHHEKRRTGPHPVRMRDLRCVSREGRRMTGEKIVESMIPMHDRSNGLGGGFAAYGIYPEYRDYYAFHIFFDSRDTRKTCEALLKEGFEIVKAEHIPIRQIPEITDVPLIWRYFLAPMQSVLNRLPAGRGGIRGAHRDEDQRRAPGCIRVFQRQKYGDLQGGWLSGGRGPVLSP